MTVSMYKISVPIFVQFLTALGVVLDKAAAHCEAKKIDPSALLNARLFPDMFPLVRQVRAATDHAATGGPSAPEGWLDRSAIIINILIATNSFPSNGLVSRFSSRLTALTPGLACASSHAEAGPKGELPRASDSLIPRV